MFQMRHDMPRMRVERARGRFPLGPAWHSLHSGIPRAAPARHAFAHAHARAHAQRCTRAHAHTHTHTHARTHAHLNTQTHAHAHPHTCTNTCTCGHAHAHMHIYICKCASLRTSERASVVSYESVCMRTCACATSLARMQTCTRTHVRACGHANAQSSYTCPCAHTSVSSCMRVHAHAYTHTHTQVHASNHAYACSLTLCHVVCMRICLCAYACCAHLCVRACVMHMSALEWALGAQCASARARGGAAQCLRPHHTRPARSKWWL